MDEPNTDFELLERITAGDAGSLAVLYERHAQMVFRTALRLTANREDASDIVQDVFIRLHRKAGGIRPRGSLKAWLRRVAVNMVIDRARRENRQGFSNPLQTAEEGPTPEDELMGREGRIMLLALLSTLPEKQRTAVIYRFFLEMDIEGVARALSLTPGSTRVTLTRALKKMRRRLGRTKGYRHAGMYLLDEKNR